MRISSLAVGATGTIFALISIRSLAVAQVVGCDAINVDCPNKGDHDNGQACVYPDSGLGIASLNSSFSPDGPITWTLRTVSSKNSRYHTIYDKTLLIGSPPSLNFALDPGFQACSLFFFNVTPALQPPPNFTDYAIFQCDTVLGNGCQQALLAQARVELNRALDDSTNESSQNVCDSASVSIRRQLPTQCQIPDGRSSWGFLSAYSLSNPVHIQNPLHMLIPKQVSPVQRNIEPWNNRAATLRLARTTISAMSIMPGLTRTLAMKTKSHAGSQELPQ